MKAARDWCDVVNVYGGVTSEKRRIKKTK